jgi:hypothetical protein
MACFYLLRKVGFFMVFASFCLLAPSALIAKDKKKKPKFTRMLIGRYIETKRLKPDSTLVNFTDTLFMTFGLRDSFTYRLRNGFVYRGKYTLSEEGHLEFGTASYEVALNKPNNIILYNNAGIYYFVYDTSDTAQVIVLEKEEKILPVTEIDSMIGHWTVYKKNVDKDGTAVDFSFQIKSVYITGQGSDDKKGYIFGSLDPASVPSWYITGLGADQSLECTGKSTRLLRVVKCQKGELVLQEGDVTYYFKQFR